MCSKSHASVSAMMRSRAVRKRVIASDGQLLMMYHRGTPEGFDSIARTRARNRSKRSRDRKSTKVPPLEPV